MEALKAKMKIVIPDVEISTQAESKNNNQPSSLIFADEQWEMKVT